MNDLKLGIIETRFADIIWSNAPISSGELVKKSFETLGWKKSTTYTVLKKLIDKGIFTNEQSIVKVKISREDFFTMQSQKFVDETFDGSLPAFIAAFTAKKALSEEEINEIRHLIDNYGKE